jgi:hypothetical protein
MVPYDTNYHLYRRIECARKVGMPVSTTPNRRTRQNKELHSPSIQNYRVQHVGSGARVRARGREESETEGERPGEAAYDSE